MRIACPDNEFMEHATGDMPSSDYAYHDLIQQRAIDKAYSFLVNAVLSKDWKLVEKAKEILRPSK